MMLEVYEKLKNLKDDPDAFETARKEILEQFFLKIPENRRLKLRQRQFRIDKIRFKLKKNPLSCAQVIFNEMTESLHELTDAWKAQGVNIVKQQLKTINTVRGIHDKKKPTQRN